uniref:Gfo/Idh/MocA family protein n=1 Tax=Ningiella ruwaisensis TaxID=2364274 RepID=UPI00109F0B0D|nr:Gfo/Idh/MocA family oxidoreductase [Ningiella ruwaisensis]
MSEDNLNKTRRRLITGLAGGLGFTLSNLSHTGPISIDAVKTLNQHNSFKLWKVGLIGCGWYGNSDLFKLIQVANVEVVALCDVDQKHLDKAAALVSQRQKSKNIPEKFSNYQTMLANTNLDIVIIGTPDHWHALQCIDALKAGAHVYLQKPISVDVIEGEALVAAAKKYGKVIQVGLQRRFTPHILNAKAQVLEKGLLGDVHHVDMWCYYHMRANRHPGPKPIPDYFDYEAWTGPAPMREYDGLPHRMWWRGFMEYSNGILGDMCVHMYDTVRWLLDLGWPKQVSSQGGIYVQTQSKANTSDTQSAVFEHDKLNCVWQHRSWGTSPNPEYPWAFALHGSKGSLIASTMKAEFIPNDKDTKPMRFEVVYEKNKYPMDLVEEDIEHNAAPATRLQMLDFIHAIETGREPVADIEQSHISTASCILANLAMELGRPLRYDPNTRTVIDDKEATVLLAREYREGYVHPQPDTI